MYRLLLIPVILYSFSARAQDAHLSMYDAAPLFLNPAMTGVVDATFHIVVKTQQQQVSIHIRDQGPGIEPHHLERIFEAFFSTKQRDGLGLGLSISQRIVQSFGGHLEVRNAPQGGAEFIIVLLLATGS